MAKDGKDGKEFESLLHGIYSALAKNDRYTTVERDVQIEGPDGPRQFDVVLRSEVASHKFTTVIECRDYKSRLNVTAVDGFHSKMIDARVNAGVLVSRKGFTDGAKSKAKRLGIVLCTASNATEILSSLKLRIPVVATEIGANFGGTQAHISLKQETRVESRAIFTVNGKWLPDVFRDEVIAGKFVFPLESGTIDWTPTTLSAPFSIMSLKGEELALENPRFVVTIVASHYFGYLNDLPDAVAMHDLSNLATHVILKLEDFPRIKDSLLPYKKADIPQVAAIALAVISVPTVVHGNMTLRWKNTNTGETFYDGDGAF